ncbi:MAG: hypothetical protein H6812_10675 [Phycisphaeraceae bacterium]|nr:hypothetical protein [Phycisphaerales bacterium]MCB9843710.1 hypothetical protein [Phycisphaeraceae bacterium]
MQKQQQQQPEPGGWTPVEDARNAAALLMFAAQVLSAPVEPFLRTRFGVKYFGMPSFFAFLCIPVWMLLWPEKSPAGIVIFWGLFVLMQLRARIESARMMMRGDIVHTRYNGRPRLAAILRRTPEHKIKCDIEPWVVIIAGGLLMAVSPPLGSYLMLSGFCLAICGGVAESVDRARVMQLHDAWLEQQALADRFREMQDNRK